MTNLLFLINILIDEGKKLEIDKTINLIEKKNIIEYLKNNYKLDLSLYNSEEIFKVNEIIYLEYEGYGNKGRIRKKLGIEKEGFTLLIALITSYIQNEFGDKEIDPSNIPTTINLI